MPREESHWTSDGTRKQYFVYIIYSEKLNKFYVGTTDDIENRLLKHNNGFYGQAFTKKHNGRHKEYESSDVKPEVNHIPIFHNVIFSFNS